MYTMSNSQRRIRGSLGADEILDAAERVAADGFDAMTIRAVATEVGSSPMALYRYFATKDSLVDALLDRVLARVHPRLSTDDWLDDLRYYAFAHARVLIEHPWAITPLFSNPNPGLGAARVGEDALAILARGGIEGPDAVAAFSGILGLNYGWAAFAAPHRSALALQRQVESLPPGAFPYSVAVAAELSRYAGQDNYERTLEFLLAGIGAAAVQ
jgi:AcrR family transcriptional regulator